MVLNLWCSTEKHTLSTKLQNKTKGHSPNTIHQNETVAALPSLVVFCAKQNCSMNTSQTHKITTILLQAWSAQTENVPSRVLRKSKQKVLLQCKIFFWIRNPSALERILASAAVETQSHMPRISRKTISEILFVFPFFFIRERHDQQISGRHASAFGVPLINFKDTRTTRHSEAQTHLKFFHKDVFGQGSSSGSRIPRLMVTLFVGSNTAAFHHKWHQIIRTCVSFHGGSFFGGLPGSPVSLVCMLNPPCGLGIEDQVAPQKVKHS